MPAVKRAPPTSELVENVKKLKKTPSEAVAVNACANHFKEFSEEEVYLHKKDAATMFDDVLRGVRAKKKDKKFPLGSNFYKMVRERYPKTKQNALLLTPPVPAENVKPMLMKAMISSKQRRPDHSLMLSFLGSQSTANVTELIGVIRWAQLMNPNAKKMAVCCIAFGRFVVRTGVEASWKEIFKAVIKPICDKTIRALWQRATAKHVKNKPTAVLFCQTQSDLVSSIFPSADLKKVLECEGNWTTVQTQLNTLASTGQAVLDIWSFALVQVLSKKISDTIEKRSADWAREGVLTEEGLQKAKCDAIDEVSAFENYELVPQRRTVALTCGGLPFICELDSVVSEISVSMSFLWRPMAVSQEKLAKFWCHDVVLARCEVAASRTVCETLIKKSH